MTPDERQHLEKQLEAAHNAGNLTEAATLAIRGYGPEILGFVAALTSNPEFGADVFGQVCEDLWRGLPKFERRASFRTWFYALARNAAFDQLGKIKRTRERNLPLDEAPAALEAVQAVKTTTMPFLKSETKSRFAKLRETLPLEDQTLLILRLDKGLDWNDLARVLSAPPDEDDLKRESARLRKRFQLVKDKLRELARRDGLLPG